jgi:hypothetical protein
MICQHLECNRFAAEGSTLCEPCSSQSSDPLIAVIRCDCCDPDSEDML